MSKVRRAKNVQVQCFACVGEGTDVVVEALASGYHDPGSCYGPPENCYPPESECELDEFSVCTDPEGTVIPWEHLTVNDQDKITDALEQAFWDGFEDARDAG